MPELHLSDSGDALLLESGDTLLLELVDVEVPSDVIETVPGVAPGTQGFGTAAAPGIVGEWTINVRRASDLQAVVEVDQFISAEFVFRFNDVGNWVLELDITDAAADHLLEPKAGIVVYRGTELVFSGPVTKRRRVWDGDQDRLVVSGFSDMAWLVWRVASPQPTTAAPPYSTNEHDVRTGVCSTIIRQYVDVNAGPGALTPREVPHLTLAADPVVGETVTGEARWQTVLEIVQKLATKAENVGFDLAQVPQPAGTDPLLVFETFQIVDRSDEIIFSPDFGNLLGFDYDVAVPEANYIYSGGQGEGIERTIVEVSDVPSIFEHGRIEKFRDARNHDTAATQTQDANEQLLELVGEISLDVRVRDLAQMAFLDHYQLGDRVSAVIDGEVVTEAIREVTVTMNAAETLLVEPRIATPKRTGLLKVLDELREHERRLNGLERI